MKMIVASTRVQQRNLKHQHPDDLVVVEGDRVQGYRVSEIVDETHVRHYGSHRDRMLDWWDYARCRVEAS